MGYTGIYISFTAMLFYFISLLDLIASITQRGLNLADRGEPSCEQGLAVCLVRKSIRRQGIPAASAASVV